MNPIQQQGRSQNIYFNSDTTSNVPSNVNDVRLDNMTDVFPLSFSFENSAYFQETTAFAEYSFFYMPPNDIQIYDIVCKETPTSFELVSQLLSNNNNSSIFYSNLHEFYFLKYDEKICYKVSCELTSHSSIVRFLN